MSIRSSLAALARPFRWLWRAVTGLAEDLSHVGHGGGAWREDSLEPNPYAGAGPKRDESRPGAATEGRR